MKVNNSYYNGIANIVEKDITVDIIIVLNVINNYLNYETLNSTSKR